LTEYQNRRDRCPLRTIECAREHILLRAHRAAGTNSWRMECPACGTYEALAVTIPNPADTPNRIPPRFWFRCFGDCGKDWPRIRKALIGDGISARCLPGLTAMPSTPGTTSNTAAKPVKSAKRQLAEQVALIEQHAELLAAGKKVQPGELAMRLVMNALDIDAETACAKIGISRSARYTYLYPSPDSGQNRRSGL
jgi:hypothetical protein